MLTIFVSYDCGGSYFPEFKFDQNNKEEVKAAMEKCKKYDEDWLRWCIEDENGTLVSISRIHKQIFATF